MSLSEFGRSSKSSVKMANRLSLLRMLVFCLVMSQFIFDLLPIEEFCGLSLRLICMLRSIPVCMVEEHFLLRVQHTVNLFLVLAQQKLQSSLIGRVPVELLFLSQQV